MQFDGSDGEQRLSGRGCARKPHTSVPGFPPFLAQARQAHVTGHQGHASALASASGPAYDAGQGESSLDSILTASAFQKLQPCLLTHLESGGCSHWDVSLFCFTGQVVSSVLMTPGKQVPKTGHDPRGRLAGGGPSRDLWSQKPRGRSGKLCLSPCGIDDQSDLGITRSAWRLQALPHCCPSVTLCSHPTLGLAPRFSRESPWPRAAALREGRAGPCHSAATACQSTGQKPSLS